MLSPQAILDRLERHLPVLSTGARDVPARQRTLHATIGWSHDLLDSAERRLFARLSVFAGGWTLEAAEEVCNPAAELEIDTLDGLASLADNSLVRPVPVPGDDAESRFTMLQVIREFAAEKLDEEPEAEAIRRRHADWVMRLAEAGQPELRRNDLRRWQSRLRREEENLRSALRWALDRGEAEVGLRTASAVLDFWHYRAEVRDRATRRATEARTLYERSGDTTSAELASGWMVIEPVIVGLGKGDQQAAIRSLEQAFDVSRSLGRAHDAADWLGGRAMLHRMIGDPQRGLSAARDSIAAWYELGNLGRLPLAFKALAALELQAGEPRRAVRLEAAARRLSDDIGGDLYQVFGQLGDPIEEARPLLGPEEHARAVDEGRTLGLDEQVAYALRPTT